MCGIAGITNFKGDPAPLIRRMNAHLKHRGPDAEGGWWNDDATVCFGHRRLSVIDLTEAGAQPFVSRSGRYVMVYNGEIYNHKIVAASLTDDGGYTSFKGTSDTEILIEAIEHFGIEEALKMCKGMWALALYDHRTHEIILARDRIGQKPLYYGFIGDQFVFASELNCFKEVEGFTGRIEEGVLPVYFAHGYIPAPYSIYQGIYKLMPGTILRIRSPYQPFVPTYPARHESGSGYEISTYWDLAEVARDGALHPFQGSRKEAADQLETILTRVIREQMVADVPVGAFLSGGIDSATIVSLMQHTGVSVSGMERVMRAKNGMKGSGRVRTFTIGFEDRDYDEAMAAREIARHLGTDHTELYISERQAKDVIPRLPQMYGEPFADSSQIPTYLVSWMTRQHVTVSLSGDGGDELFAGYRSYDSVSRIWGKLSGVPHTLRAAAGRMMEPRAETALQKHLAANGGIEDAQAEKLRIRMEKARLLQATSPEDLYRIQLEELDGRIRRIPLKRDGLPYYYLPLREETPEGSVRKIMYADLRMYHPDDILAKVDRAAMSVSLETRIPFLDREVVEFSWTLPIAYLRDDTTGKLLLRDVLFRHVPEELMNRPKKGFSVPIAKWLMEKDLRDWAEDLLSEARIKREGLLDAAVVRSLWEDYLLYGRWSSQIWYLLMFESWLEMMKPSP